MAAAIRGLDAEETRALTLAMLRVGRALGAGRARSRGSATSTRPAASATRSRWSSRRCSRAAGCRSSCSPAAASATPAAPSTSWRASPGWTCGSTAAAASTCSPAAASRSAPPPAGIAPADRRLYALRDVTATVDSLPLITASILSKKLAIGAAAVVFDVKTGNGAFLPELDRSLELARGLVETSRALGTPAACLVTDMSQPLGRWAGHAAEVRESLDALAGRGRTISWRSPSPSPRRSRGSPASPWSGGRWRRRSPPAAPARRFERWAALQGADPAWLRAPRLRPRPGRAAAPRPALRPLSPRSTCASSGSSWSRPAAAAPARTTPSTSGSPCETRVRLGAAVEEGEELARVYLRRENERLAEAFAACFTVADAGEAPPLIAGRVLSLVLTQPLRYHPAP